MAWSSQFTYVFIEEFFFILTDLLSDFLAHLSTVMFSNRRTTWPWLKQSSLKKPDCWKSRREIGQAEQEMQKRSSDNHFNGQIRDTAIMIQKWVCWLGSPNPEEVLNQHVAQSSHDFNWSNDKDNQTAYVDEVDEAAYMNDAEDEIYETEWNVSRPDNNNAGSDGDSVMNSHALGAASEDDVNNAEVKLSVRQLNRNRRILRQVRSLQYPEGLCREEPELPPVQKTTRHLLNKAILTDLEGEVISWKQLAMSFLPSDLRRSAPGTAQFSRVIDLVHEKLDQWKHRVHRFDTVFFLFAKQLSKLLLRWQEVRLQQAASFVRQCRKLHGFSLDGYDYDTGKCWQDSDSDSGSSTTDGQSDKQSVPDGLSLISRANTWNGHFQTRQTFFQDLFKTSFAAALSKVNPSFAIFYYKSFSSCELFHTCKVPSPRQYRVDISNDLNDFLRYECRLDTEARPDFDFAKLEDTLEIVKPYRPDCTKPVALRDLEPYPYQHSLKYYLATTLAEETLLHHDESHILNKQQVSQGELFQLIRNLPDKLDKENGLPEIQGTVSFYGGQEKLQSFLSGLPFNAMGFCQSRDRIDFDKDLGVLAKFQYYLQNLKNPTIQKKKGQNPSAEGGEKEDQGQNEPGSSGEVDQVKPALNKNASLSGLNNDEEESVDDEFSVEDHGGSRYQFQDCVAVTETGLAASAENEHHPQKKAKNRRRERVEFLRRFYNTSSDSEDDEVQKSCLSHDQKRDEVKVKKSKRCMDGLRPQLQHAYLNRDRTVVRKSFPEDRTSSISLDYMSFLLNYLDLDNVKVVHAVLYPARPYLNGFINQILQSRWDIRNQPSKRLLATSLKVCGNGIFGFSGTYSCYIVDVC